MALDPYINFVTGVFSLDDTLDNQILGKDEWKATLSTFDSGVAPFAEYSGSYRFNSYLDYFYLNGENVIPKGVEDYCVEVFFRIEEGKTQIQTPLAIANSTNGRIARIEYQGQDETLALLYRVKLEDTFTFRTVTVDKVFKGLEWHHLALTRHEGEHRVWLDGEPSPPILSPDPSPDDAQVTMVIQLSRMYERYFEGWMSALRITKGHHRYDEPFTPPDKPYNPFSGVLRGVVLDPDGNPISRTVRAFGRESGVMVSEAVSDPATGEYKLGAPAGTYQIVAFDDEWRDQIQVATVAAP
jgi:hypothetical protein